ncbi:MAG: hypothetical protein F9K40_16875 [Kofleriaceae bacterium]|nr:MAG: hypothetical protein F9K40_16875 [Kofleriaceae bacterium]
MTAIASREHTGRLAVLALLLAAACAAVLYERLVLAVPLAVFLGMFVVVASFAVFLRLHRDTWGREGRYVDLWSIAHFLVGALAFLAGVELPYLMVISLLWELVELAARVHEHPANRAIDVALAAAGWLVARAAIA